MLFNLFLYLIPTSTILLIAFLMYSTDKRKFSGEKCNCCGKPMTLEETFASSTCGHCLLAIRRLSEGAPEGYVPARVRQLSVGDIFTVNFLSSLPLKISKIEDNKFMVDVLHTAKDLWRNDGSMREWQEFDKYKMGVNSQEWVWKKLENEITNHTITTLKQE